MLIPATGKCDRCGIDFESIKTKLCLQCRKHIYTVPNVRNFTIYAEVVESLVAQLVDQDFLICGNTKRR